MFLILFAAPAVAGLAVEYLCFRLPKHRWPRWLPPLFTVAAAVVVTFLRYHGWSSTGEEKAPIETLLFIPGIPALSILLGQWLGWRVWKRLWSPRVVKDGKRGE